MITGIGTDFCDIRRIEKNIENFGDRFLDKVFTLPEREYCDGKTGRASCYAKRFAAKEAVAKALARPGTGGLGWHEVEVLNDPSGRPRVILSGKARDRLPDHKDFKVHLSLTDDYPYAQAFSVIEARAMVDL
ncbi:MAG: holo-ACP synthase [Hyphomonadaceae bacterium]|nr:holo-ACP synthase [Hyphomonadaceae bacterium]MBC6411835.1 holo-ACP synthase [Hyphomonadaceae bacterium]